MLTAPRCSALLRVHLEIAAYARRHTALGKGGGGRLKSTADENNFEERPRSMSGYTTALCAAEVCNQSRNDDVVSQPPDMCVYTHVYTSECMYLHTHPLYKVDNGCAGRGAVLTVMK